MEDNVISVVQKTIKYYKIRVTRTTTHDYLLSHPYYPALKSVCDAFKKWGVEHYPVRLQIPEIVAMRSPFIAHLSDRGGQLAFVYSISEKEVVYSTELRKKLHEPSQAFASRLSGAVILINPNDKAGEGNYREKRHEEWLEILFLPILILTIFSIGFYNALTRNISLADQTYWPITGIILSGFLVSLILVLNEFKLYNPIFQSLCKFGQKTDCQYVVDSKASHIFGWIGWADIGFIYFAGLLLYLLQLQSQDSLRMMAFVSVLSLPYPIYSVYYQAVKVGKWCSLCLLVQFIIILEFILLLPYLTPLTLSYINFLNLMICLLVPGTLYYSLKINWLKRKSHKKEHNIFLTLQGDPEVFRLMLMKNEPLNIPVSDNSLVFGNHGAENTLTVFMSFHCKPCSVLFAKIRSLLTTLKKVKVVIVFWVKDDLLSRRLINHIYRLYNGYESENVLIFLDNWFNDLDRAMKELNSLDPIHVDCDFFEHISKENQLLFKQCNINGTPEIFLDGYKYPSIYEPEQIELLSDELLRTIREGERQEAHAIKQSASCRHAPFNRKGGDVTKIR